MKINNCVSKYPFKKDIFLICKRYFFFTNLSFFPLFASLYFSFMFFFMSIKKLFFKNPVYLFLYYLFCTIPPRTSIAFIITIFFFIKKNMYSFNKFNPITILSFQKRIMLCSFFWYYYKTYFASIIFGAYYSTCKMYCITFTWYYITF